jgi:hypothetical protein
MDWSSSTTRTVWLGGSTPAASLVLAPYAAEARNPIRGMFVYYLKMRNEPTHSEDMGRELERVRARMPRPTPYFRRRSWLEFQRALDPLGPLKLPQRRQQS